MMRHDIGDCPLDEDMPCASVPGCAAGQGQKGRQRPRGPARGGMPGQIGCATAAATVKLEPWRNKLSETSQVLLLLPSSKALLPITLTAWTAQPVSFVWNPSGSLSTPGHSAKGRGSRDVRDVIVPAHSPAQPTRPPDRQRDPDKPTEARRQSSAARRQKGLAGPEAQIRASRNFPMYRFVQARLFGSCPSGRHWRETKKKTPKNSRGSGSEEEPPIFSTGALVGRSGDRDEALVDEEMGLSPCHMPGTQARSQYQVAIVS